MHTRFRTLLLAGAALLGMSGSALAQQVTLDGIPANKLGNYKITCTDRDNAAGQPCFVSLSQGGQAASTANPVPVADGADPASPTLANPGVGSRGWLASTAASNAVIASATGTQSDAATASGANTTVIGALRTIRDRVLGVLSAQLYQGGTAVSQANPTFVQATNLAAATNAGATSTTAQPVQGAGAAGTPLVGGALFNTTPPTLTNGQLGALQGDANANLKVNTIAAGGSTAANQANEISLLSSIQTRASVFAEQINASVASGATITGATRDVGAPAVFSKFNVAVQSNQAGTIYVQSSNDNFTTIANVASVAVTANTPATLIVPVIYRYNRSLFVNGATAATASVNSSYTAN